METGNQSSSNQNNPLVAKVKALLMRAWRERWNEVQWGVQLKRVMNSTPGDTKDLAGTSYKCELQMCHEMHSGRPKVPHGFKMGFPHPKQSKKNLDLSYKIDPDI